MFSGAVMKKDERGIRNDQKEAKNKEMQNKHKKIPTE